MKRLKTLSILLVIIITVSLAGVSISAQEQEYYVGGRTVYGQTTDGRSGSAIFIDIQHGSATFTSSSNNIYTITVSPDPGYRLESYDLISENIRDFNGSTVTCDVSVSGNDVIFLFTMLIDEETLYGVDGEWDYTQGLSIHQSFIDNLANAYYWNYGLNWMFASNVVYTDTPLEPQPLPDLYTVRVESNPAGVAVFSGYGTGFQDGQAYNVAIASQDSDYEFTGWSESPTGTISGSDVSLVANFEMTAEAFEDEQTPEGLEIKYEVSAKSQPAEVADFTGEGLFRNGDSFKVAVDTVVDGYEFIQWETVNAGVVDGSDVEVVAIFAEITDEPVEEVVEEPIEEPTEEPDEVLDEEPVPEEVETLPETSGVPFVVFTVIGAMVTGSGVVLRKKK